MRWIKANKFGVDTKAKYDELDKVYTLWEGIMNVTTENEDLKYHDVRPFAGKSDELQKAYLSKYESEFPKFKVNVNFEGHWDCKKNYV